MTPPKAIGAPMPMADEPVELVVAEAGEYEEGEGMVMTIRCDRLVVRARLRGEEAEASCGIEELLEAICHYSREHGN